MLIEVKVPVLPESITEATLVSWHKKAGDAVKRDENLVDIETDKVVLELPAPDSGVLTEIRRGDGSTVTAQEVIAVLDTGAQSAARPASQQRRRLRPRRQPRPRRRIRLQLQEMHPPQRHLPPRPARPHCLRRAR